MLWTNCTLVDTRTACNIAHATPHVQALMTQDMCNAVSIGANGSLRVWDMEVGTSSITTKPGKPYTHLHLAGSDRVLVVTAQSHRAAIVSLNEKAEVMRLEAQAPICTCLVHPMVRSPALPRYCSPRHTSLAGAPWFCSIVA